AVDKVLLAIGRAGSIANLNLEKIGIKYNHKNFIETNEKYQTAQKHIYAIGDVAGKYLYAHTAAAEGKQVAEIIVGIRDNTKFNAVPFTIFTYPELAWCGLTEQEAIDKKINYKKSIYHLRGLGRAHTLGEISGLVKFIVDADTELIIGCHIIGARATELIHTVQLAMNNNLKISALAELIAAHPSMSEALMETARLIED
ncbi:MAG TPA: FAD-dependent oxidoreductase, partial [bacterium]|nr:FAD-dependent oxidoreductase [bacterium]